MSLWIPKELTTVSLVLLVMVNSLYGKLSVVIKAFAWRVHCCGSFILTTVYLCCVFILDNTLH